MFAELVVRHAHEYQTDHSDREYVLSVIRQHFWIPKSQPLINRVLPSCVLCKRMNSALGVQKMSDLPPNRVNPSNFPFTCIGVDCFGLFRVKWSWSHKKRF